MSLRALIFDFDGVLVDTEPLHMRAWMDVLSPFRILFSKEDYYARYIGLNDRDFLAKIFGEKKKPFTSKSSERLIHQKEGKTKESLSKNIPLMEGADDFLKKSALQYPLGLVTGALPNEVYFILDRLDWRKLFSVIITSGDIEKGKPDPEGFLKAFEQLRTLEDWTPPLEKSQCLIFEDSQNGILAAKNAGIPYHRITSKSWTTASYLPNGGKI